jgi:hypothetical protein
MVYKNFTNEKKLIRLIIYNVIKNNNLTVWVNRRKNFAIEILYRWTVSKKHLICCKIFLREYWLLAYNVCTQPTKSYRVRVMSPLTNLTGESYFLIWVQINHFFLIVGVNKITRWDSVGIRLFEWPCCV